jgi:hypothetical protein
LGGRDETVAYALKQIPVRKFEILFLFSAPPLAAPRKHAKVSSVLPVTVNTRATHAQA